ncbi:MAG: DUF4221 family protein [Flavobacteriales bacterium]|nr:DUF4221 family protein [Flavobacteriales bacterium]
MVNNKGEKIDEWIIDYKLSTYEEYDLSGNRGSRIEYQDGKCFIFHYPEFAVLEPEFRKRYFNTPIELTIDLKERKVINFTGKFPEYFQEKEYYVFNSTRALNKKKLIYSFANDNDLYVYNQGIEKISVKSNFFEQSPTFDYHQYAFDYKKIEQYLVENFRYDIISFDPFRKQYYRVCLHKTNYENSNGTINKFVDKPFSIMVLDEKFNLIKEVVFPKAEFDFTKIFVVKEGLMFSKSHPMKNDEFIKFAVYEL